MINKLTIKKPNVKKVKKQLDFSTKDGEKTSTFPFVAPSNLTIPSEFNPTQIYFEDNKVYFFDNGQLFSLKNGRVNLLTDIEFDNPPYIATIKIGDKKDILVFTEKMAEFNGKGEPFPFEPFNAYLTYEDKMFIAFENLLYLVRFDDFSGANVESEFCFNGQKEDGEIVGIKTYNDDILLLFEHKIVILSFSKDPGDITIERVLTPYFHARKDSLRICGDKAIFIDGDRLCIYKKGALTFTNLTLGIKDCIYPHVSSSGCFYLIPYSKDGKNCLLVYDAEENTLTDINADAKNISKEKGYFSSEDGTILHVSKALSANEKVGNDSVKTGLDDCGKKVLTLIEVHAVGSATLKVSTSFVEKEYKIQSGCNKIHCNICDESFYFNFMDKSNDFCAIKTNLTYIKLGE